MVKRTITITTILLILTIAVGLLVMLNKSTLAADDDIASGISGTCSWVIDSEGVLTISPTDGVSGTLNDADFMGSNFIRLWWKTGLPEKVTKVIVEQGVKTGTSCKDMFNNLYNCTEIDLTGLDTSNATNMEGMFCGCSSITSIDVSNLVTTNVTTMRKMFYSCCSLQTLDLSMFDMSNVTDIREMFSGFKTTAYSDIDLERNNNACKNLTSINGISDWNTSNITQMSGLFNGCASLQSLDLSTWDVSKVTSFERVFSNCISLSNLTINTWDVSNATTLAYLFSATQSLTSLDIANWDVSNVQEFNGLFFTMIGISGYYNVGTGIEYIDLSSWDTSSAIYMNSMFSGCTNLIEVDVSHFNMSKVTNIAGMFENCYKLKTIDVSNWNTSSIERITHTFHNCYLVEVLDFSNCDLSNVKYLFASMIGVFENCRSLKKLDLHTMSNPDIEEAAYMFKNCHSLEELDISNLVTINMDYSLFQMFYGCNFLKKVSLGENFCFKGNGTLNNSNKYAILNSPSYGFPYTGKWIREDDAYGPYTPLELVNNYDGTIMAGTWIWEKTMNNYTVSYSYSGNIPNGVSNLPETVEYESETIVTVAPEATALGYTFSGWSRTGTFEMPAENVEITGSFTANTDTPYKVEHYLEDLVEGTYTLTKTDNLTGTTDTEAQAIAKNYEGFTFDNSVVGTKLSGNIAGDGSLVLKLYYKRNSYNVTYDYTGDFPNDASPLPQSETYKYGSDINVPENATAEGYTFSGWIKDYITMPAQDIEITGYFIENPKSYNYRIEYYFDGELDESLEEIRNAEEDKEISLTPQTSVKHKGNNYTLVSKKHKIIVSANEAQNIIKIYYETDVLDYEIDNSEDTTEGDGIPDKYQIAIYYKVDNGSWDDGTKETKTNIVTLRDKNGNYAEDGTGELNIPQVGNKPAEGYTTGSWNKKIPKRVSSKDNGKEFVYSYKTISKADISRAKGNLSNPKTDDIMHNYILVGVAGVLVLMVVRKIRRKYSRKAKRIQY